MASPRRAYSPGGSVLLKSAPWSLILVERQLDQGPPAVAIAPGDLVHARATSAPSISARSAVAPSGTVRVHVATSPGVSPRSAVAPGDLVHARATSAPAVSPRSTVAPVDLARARATTSPGVSLVSTDVPPGNVARATPRSRRAAVPPVAYAAPSSIAPRSRIVLASLRTRTRKAA